MQAHADVETVFAAGLHHVLVSADTGSFQSCREEEQNKVEGNVHFVARLWSFGIEPTTYSTNRRIDGFDLLKLSLQHSSHSLILHSNDLLE